MPVKFQLGADIVETTFEENTPCRKSNTCQRRSNVEKRRNTACSR